MMIIDTDSLDEVENRIDKINERLIKLDHEHEYKRERLIDDLIQLEEHRDQLIHADYYSNELDD